MKYLAIEAGFSPKEAETIAYSSQYVDDNSIIHRIKKEDNSIYENYISQTMNIFKPTKSLMRIYLLFHFLPGDPIHSNSRRKDGKMHLLNTTKASTHATEIFFDATRSENLYLLGIASHMLSDTYSHQNFIGTFDEMNAFSGLWQRLVPNIGHADAGQKPDIPNLIWQDPRLIEENAVIDNKKLFLAAAKKIYRNFILVTSSTNNWISIKDNLGKIIGEPIDESKLKKEKNNRIEMFKSLLAEYDRNNDYNKNSWFKETVNEDATFKENYTKLNWYKFQEAIKHYQKIATHKMKPILEQMEIKEW